MRKNEDQGPVAASSRRWTIAAMTRMSSHIWPISLRMVEQTYGQFELLRGVTWIMAQNGGRDRD